MDTFLQSASLHLTKVKANDRIHVVLGNEACDLDSVVSAIVYAYFIHKGNTKPDTLIVPVLNLFRREFHLRPDINRFLDEVGIKSEQLIFRDNIDLKNLSSTQRLSLTLVDHNILQREDRELFPLVEEVIDHHHKEVDYDLNKCKVIIERVGSTCTLIGEKLFKELPEIFDTNIALLLYGTILLDTYCLREEAKRVTPKDKEIVEKLEAILGFNERDKLFNKLQSWKNDVSGMSLMDLLRKDLKIISNNTMRIAVSSVPILLENLLKESKSEQDLRNFVAETSSQILVIMGIYIDNNASERSLPIRQIAVFSNHQSYLEQIVDLLEDASLKGPTLRLSHLETPIPKVNLYNQGNIAASRKAVLPLLNSFLGGRPPLLSIGSYDGASPSSSENHANNRRPTPEGRNEEDEVVNFDPLAAESEDVVVDSVGSALAHLHVMGIGDPISHAGSSQSSSNQNSCPYTPQNSCCDGGISEDPYARQILPSFNSREMMEKIESKRGKLRGYVGDGEGDASTTSYPFTPKNSFVDGGFDNYIRGTSNDTGEFMLQVNDRVARINAKRTEPDGAGSSNSKPTQNGSVGSGGGGGNDIEPLTPDRNPEGKDNSNCPEGTSSSDKLDKSDYKMDISETSNSSEKTSPIIDTHHYSTTSQLLNKFSDENQVSKSNEIRKTSSDFNTNNANHVTTSSRTDSTISMSSLHDDLDLPSNYLTETVDFPDSPQQLKLMQRSTNGFQNLTEDSWMDQQEDEMLRNVLSPENEEFKSRKDTTNDLDEFITTIDSCSLNNSDSSSDLLDIDQAETKFLQFSTSTPINKEIARAKRSSKLTPLKEDASQIPSLNCSELENENRSIIEKVDKFYKINDRIKDLGLLCDNIRSELNAEEIDQLIEKKSIFIQYLDEYFYEALETALELGQVSAGKKKIKLKVDWENLDDSIANHFENELGISAVFERKPSIRNRRRKSSEKFYQPVQPQKVVPTPSTEENDEEVVPTKLLIPVHSVIFEEDSAKQSDLSSNSVEKITNESELEISSENSLTNFAIDTCDFSLNPSRIDLARARINDSKIESSPERPSSLNTGGKKKRKIKVNPDILNTSDENDDKSLSSLSNRSDGDIISPSLDDIVTPDDIATPDVLDDSVFSPRELIPEMSAAEERDDERRWRTCVIGGVQQKIDLKVIEPYKKVLSHGGYCGPNRSAIIVFCACHLPDHGRKDYDYVMDHLFLYVLTTLDQLVAEDYYLVYLHGALEKSNMPTFGWLKRCYTLIDRRLRKNLKGLYLVHPTFWLKTIVLMTKPFISTKFARKLQFVNSLQDLFDLMPVDQMSIPDKVKQLDFKLMIRTKKKQHKGESTVHRTSSSSEPASYFVEKEEVDSDAPYRKAHSENQEFTGGWL